MDTILMDIAIMLLMGLGFERISKCLKLPSVTGYLVAGLLLGPSVFKIIPATILGQFSILSSLALGFIAFSVGGEFKLKYFKRVGFTPIVIAFTEALGAMIFVTGALLICGVDVTFSILMGAIATATAAASTIMVVKQYNAKGPVTETLLSVVALDDAFCLIIFGFAVTIAEAFTATENVSIISTLVQPIWEVGGSIFLGTFFGFIMKYPIKWSTSRNSELSIIIAFICITVAGADLLGFSSLLTCMAMGATFANLDKKSDEIMEIADVFTPPLYMMFFIISGAGLNLSVLPSIGLVGVIYIIFRVVGKILGASLGAKIMHASPNIQKYLGPTLIPQEGVAIALALLAETIVPEYAVQIRAVVLFGTLIYGIIGPAITKFSLKKAGELTV
ncbi:sodium:proton exchanger [Candidatus Epulonipiscium fishelsonii]|uniref:Sodium:proton exchanger n=1 Tax=Candidatus Epulonipiscium fishelsonii TaxID=77094 RepID=A0ACC8XJI2_9FIRM|nr:sodium:proton exchanger [Epulopiscium sp. SCG-D08WGA-EpuloA1]